MTHRLALLAALLFAASAAPAASLDGAWQLQAGEFVDSAGQRVDYGEARLQGIKVLDGGTFAFTTTRDGKFWAGGVPRGSQRPKARSSSAITAGGSTSPTIAIVAAAGW